MTRQSTSQPEALLTPHQSLCGFNPEAGCEALIPAPFVVILRRHLRIVIWGPGMECELRGLCWAVTLHISNSLPSSGLWLSG